MLQRHLKKIRVAVALLVFAWIALAFLDFGRLLPARAASLTGRLQLVPSILRALQDRRALVGVALVAASALAFGRIYCSTLCPLGTLQDLVIRLSTTRRRRRRFRFARPRSSVHLAVLAAVALLAAAGLTWPLGLTEPFSNFGRILSVLGRPPVAWLVNSVSRGLARLQVYAVAPLHLPEPGWVAVGLAFAWLAGILALSYAKGRQFCNLLCPAGAILRLLSRFSAFQLAVDGQACTACRLCERICKARCIDGQAKRIDFPSCVGCFDCLEVCPSDAIRYRLRAGPAKEPGAAVEVDGARRQLLQGALATAGAVALGAAGPAGAGEAAGPITPPGSGDRDRFTSKCTACHLCLSVCPTQVLRPALLEYGPAGLLQPRIVFQTGACVYECNACSQVCPTGAIAPQPLPEKQLVQIGRARFVEDRCVVTRKKTACLACAEHCPTKAIEMVPYQAGLKIPTVNEELCIGCGACEHPCPAAPKAIFVEARPRHGRAKRLARSAGPARPAGGGDFPF